MYELAKMVLGHDWAMNYLTTTAVVYLSVSIISTWILVTDNVLDRRVKLVNTTGHSKLLRNTDLNPRVDPDSSPSAPLPFVYHPLFEEIITRQQDLNL